MNCPICSAEMTEQRVSPCFDCGTHLSEVEEVKIAQHKFARYELWGLELVLCDFCDTDLDSYYPEYWGLPHGSPQSYPLHRLQAVEQPEITTAFVCPSCRKRSHFLRLLAEVRQRFAGG